MHTMPIRMSHQEDNNDNTVPATAATPNAPNAANFTCNGWAIPDPTNRRGPLRVLSVPRIPSE